MKELGSFTMMTKFIHLYGMGGNNMEKCEHKELQELKQVGGPILMVCIKCNQILKVSKGSSVK